FFKIGLQLYTAEGPEIVRAVLATGAKVWLDLKLYDIPNTVARAVESASTLGVQMLTIHLSGGSAMIRAATAARASDMLFLGVTVLTSVTEQTLREIGITDGVEDQVLRLAKLGVDAGIDGVVASPHEIKSLRREFGDRIKIAVQGIRPSWAEPQTTSASGGRSLGMPSRMKPWQEFSRSCPTNCHVERSRDTSGDFRLQNNSEIPRHRLE
ncbi:MAG: orotidine-5'-phosphate decarboxylase, partial [Verrucomicrobia bacterium]